MLPGFFTGRLESCVKLQITGQGWNRERFSFRNESLDLSALIIFPPSVQPPPSRLSSTRSLLLFHLIKRRRGGRLCRRDAISCVNVATALSLSFSHHFTHKCFSSFSHLPGGRRGQETAKTGSQRAGKARTCTSPLGRCFISHVLGFLTWQPPCHVFDSPLPFPSIPLSPPFSISVPIKCLSRRGNNKRDQYEGVFNWGGVGVWAF